MKLYLIAGHGAGDSGATGNGYQEAERVRALCSEIKRIGGNNVVYLDPNRNWYADGGINSLNIPDSDCLLECHMDAASPSARGGHVIIYSGFAPDEYDKALANLMADMFAGRSQTIVKRDDLANPNRAAKRGINYRLVEFGFITNKDDVNKFNTRLTELATRVLKCFGINGSTAAKPQKSNEEIAKEVIAGKWGNGQERKDKLKAAGYDYTAVQALVNSMLK